MKAGHRTKSAGDASSPGFKLPHGWLLKACIFATGLSGIAAEYVMATLASYLLGNEVVQFALTMSLMLFAMGLGSRLSRLIKNHLLDSFIVLELLLSLLCAASALIVYSLSVIINPIGLVIYSIAFAIGILIGLEIPLVTRLNERFESLDVNISSVMEHDYYGALLGGLLFAFVALPHLGLTYTPILLGAINAAVAIALFLRYQPAFSFRKQLLAAVMLMPVILGTLAFTARPIMLYGEQQKYRDTVIFQAQSRYQKIVITEWRGDHWLYLNGNLQFSSYDEARYHEPLVHPAMQLSASHENVLILGGGDGLAAREVLKYPDVKSITLVDIDPLMTELAKNHPVLLENNRGSLLDERVTVINQDAYKFLEESNTIYDVIIADFPDPKSVSLARLYSLQFYELARRHLTPGGVFVTQATSPFFSRTAYMSILKTVRAAGFAAVPYHNQVPTLGEWGFVLGMKAPAGAKLEPSTVKAQLKALDFDEVKTRFLDAEAMTGMLAFGKDVLAGLEDIEVSRDRSPAVFRYYQAGRWDLY